MFTIAVANQKGGSGKTTTAVNLAACLAERGRKVTLVDLDPQSQATTYFRLDEQGVATSIFDVMMGRQLKLGNARVSINDNLSIVPSRVLSHDSEAELYMQPKRLFRLQEVLNSVSKETDYTVIDCPPNLGLLTHNALLASNAALLTVETSFLALHGVSRLLEVIDEIKRKHNHTIGLFALATMYDTRTRYAQEVLEDMRGFFKNQMLKTVIRRNVRLTEAASIGLPICEYRPTSYGAEDYSALAAEIDRRVKPHLINATDLKKFV
jgi:chromosome partitioning protein